MAAMHSSQGQRSPNRARYESSYQWCMCFKMFSNYQGKCWYVDNIDGRTDL